MIREKRKRVLLAGIKRYQKKQNKPPLQKLQPRFFSAGNTSCIPFYSFLSFSIPTTLNVGTEYCTPFKTIFPTSFNMTC